MPPILGTPAGEELRDPFALRQTERLQREAGSVLGRHVVLQTRGEASEEERRFEIARETEPMDVDAAGEFVYDVFVREAIGSRDEKSMAEHGATGGSGGGAGPLTGRLVVSDAHKEWLENYFWDGKEDEPDEDRVYTDDEDSNAEDYFGADYPEDEDYHSSGSDDDNDNDDNDDVPEWYNKEHGYVAEYDVDD